MIISPEQQRLFWQTWAQVSRDRKWTNRAEIERERKTLLARCGFTSLTLVDRTDGFTKVINEMRAMIGDSVQAGMEANDSLLNKARNYRHVIREVILPCLALYVEHPEAYLRSVMEDKSRWWKLDRPVRDISLDDLDAKPTLRNGKPGPSQLQQVLITLNARLHEKRRLACHTLHQMHSRAGVPCPEKCRTCYPRPIIALNNSAMVLAGEDDGNPDWSVGS